MGDLCISVLKSLLIIGALVFLVRIGGSPEDGERKPQQAGTNGVFAGLFKAKEKKKEEHKHSIECIVKDFDICELRQRNCTKRKQRKKSESICECFLERLCDEYYKSHTKRRLNRQESESTKDRAMDLVYARIQDEIDDCLTKHYINTSMVIERLQLDDGWHH